MSDLRAVAARRAHLLVAGALRAASVQRDTRDRLVRELREEDPKRWTHKALARAVGCSEELIAVIIRSTP